jgi:hypothetical protein
MDSQEFNPEKCSVSVVGWIPWNFTTGFAQGFEPINEAWSTIQMIGSPEAVEAATKLLDACGDLLGLATQPGQARSKVMTTIVGMRWTPEEDRAYQHALRRLVGEREALITIACVELGRTEIRLPNDADRATGAGAASADDRLGSGAPGQHAARRNRRRPLVRLIGARDQHGEASGGQPPSAQPMLANWRRNFSPRLGLSDSIQEMRPNTCARKSATAARFWDAGP